MSQKTATVAVINYENKCLILKRGSTAPWNPGKYCLPGGHVDDKEGLTYAASRELSEEAGISIPVDSLVPVTISYPKYSKTVFVVQHTPERVLLNYEHNDYSWISYSESLNFSLVPGLDTTLQTLVKHNYLSR